MRLSPTLKLAQRSFSSLTQFKGCDSLYYVRAIQEPTPAANGGSLRCEYDDEGNCTRVNVCRGDYRTSRRDACLSPVEERAWSSPIFVNQRS